MKRDPRNRWSPARVPGLTVAELRREMALAPPRFLAACLEHPEFGEAEAISLLRNRRAPTALLETIAADRRWRRCYEIKALLALHPASTLRLGRKLLPQLHWRELGRVGAAPRLHPVLRRMAEELLAARCEELSTGERVTLARTVPRALFTPLSEGSDPRVISSLLWNPRLLEGDAAAIAGRSRLGPEGLRRVADHPRWSRNRAVRLALAENPRTPAAVSLRLLTGLSPADLRDLARNAKVPTLVRVGAQRTLDSAR